ncbi:MAG: hypothetical protein J5858_14570, partial [Lentisphaeria bacterium]|nr:hypothetical protein [Lentisphaeria bacterium]
VEEEFKVLASLRSTIAVHKPEDWPQTLQSNQRIALFLDDLLPRTFKGHMSLRMAVIGSDNNASDYQQSVEVVLNGKRLLNSYLLRNKQLVDVVIPNDVMQPYGNILQIRNNGKVQLAFDAVELSAVNRVGKKLYLLTEKRSQLPEEMKKFFSSETSPEMKFCKISSHGENRQLLPELKEYDRDRLYIGEYSAIGNECMGNDFHKHYLRQTGREIVDWIAGGGSGMKINAILSGGRFYDSLYQTEYPAAVALKQTAKLFEGSPRRLNSQIYPKHGEKPALFLSCAASYNAPGIATVVIAKRFPIPEETEIIALIPWSGETEMVIERGFFSKQSPFRGFATPLETERKKITIKDNIFRLSGVFPELSVIRLYRSRAAKVTESSRRWHKPQSSSASASKINYSAVLKHLPPEVSKMKKYPVWQTGGFTSIFGQNVHCSVIPATEQKDKFKYFKLEEEKSLNITFKMNPGHIPGHESACLPFGNIPAKNIYALAFNIRAAAVKTKKRDHISWVTFRFGFCGKIYSTVIAMEEWQKIVLPLKGFNPSWKHLRILEPAGSFSDKIQSVSFEINDISVYAKD